MVRDLCRTRARSKDEPFQALSMGGLLEGEASEPLVTRWPGLTLGDRVWTDGATSATYARGALIPDIAKQLYGSPSEVLIEKVTKSLVWNLHYYTVLVDCVPNAGRIINNLGDKNAKIHGQVGELKVGAGSEAVDLEDEVARLKLKLEGIEQQQASLWEQLKESRGSVHSMEGELLDFSRSLEEARSSATKVEEALVEETRAGPYKEQKGD
ncbi:hypothetical protein C4D60_Mb10t24240 [Musa balbisiana]|uniref:Uncharacterized protein n=1 Tax=Musa balbisiana TaxID=52838 RepID=A0A4V4H520_MUSBA|nr:hypothetical protein C4D60_Mb10t24240 [Musa balbisiana]